MAKKILERFFQIFLNILLIFVVVILCFSMYSYVSLNVLNHAYVNFLGYTFFEVASGSMGEAIHVDDLVIVDIGSEYKKGDIVTYYSDGDFVTHRVVSIEDGKVITRGDANRSNDNPINDSAILGKVVSIIPNVGIWKKVFMTPKVFISMIITLFLFSFTFSYNRKKTKKKKNIAKEKFEDHSVADLHVTDPEIPFIKGDGDHV